MTCSSGLKLTLIGAGLFAASSAFAVQPFWHDQGRSVIHDGFGGCVQTRDWKPELMTPDCGAAPAKEEAAPAPEPAARTQPTTPPAAPPPAAVVEAMTLRGDSHFATNSAELSPPARTELARLAGRIKAMDTVESIAVVGHTDSRGAAEYNQGLSERRAESVKAYLAEQGIDAKKITATGKGLSDPIADNNTAEGRAANRRVEITIEGTR